MAISENDVAMSRHTPDSEESVGVRELKDRLSAVLRRVAAGRTVAGTRRSRRVALFVPCEGRSTADLPAELAGTGCIAWAGGKPTGSRRPPVVRGASVSDAVREGRR
jgi:antitoxin (DNA-binding transcriptional repressor) of toxin-antitoxin stability system